MKSVLPLAAISALLLAGCDNPKPRPAATAARVQAMATAPTAAPAASAGLTKRPEMAGFSLDFINEAQDPLNRPATIKAGGPITVAGFAFDPVAKAQAKAVDIVIDDVAYGTTYGHERGDVAAYFKTDGVLKSGFKATLPAAAVKRGSHTAVVRAVSVDGTGYFDSAPITFRAN